MSAKKGESIGLSLRLYLTNSRRSKTDSDRHLQRAPTAAVLLVVEERTSSLVESDAVGDAEVRVIERIEHVEPVLDRDLFLYLKCLEDTKVNRFNAVAGEAIAANVTER